MPIGWPIKPRPIRPTFVLELAAESTEVSSNSGRVAGLRTKSIVQGCAKNGPATGTRIENNLSGLGTIGQGKQGRNPRGSAGCDAGNLILTLGAQGRSFRPCSAGVFFVSGLFFQADNILVRDFPPEMSLLPAL